MYITNSSYKLFKINDFYYLFNYANPEIIKCNFSDLKLNHFSLNCKSSHKFDPPTFKLPPFLTDYNAFLAGFRKYHRYLQLIVTENCNMRCKYCFYSNNDYKYYRKHSNNVMDYLLAESAVYDLLNNNYDKEYIVAFFGGEPLLQFTLIEKVVKYIKQNFPNKRVTYRTTTNGTLLTPSIINFLADNDFALNVSIDGNKDIHDNNRVFANGKPTYDRIIRNLNYIKKHYPVYYYTNVHAHATVGNTSDYNLCLDAFKRYGFSEASVSMYVEGSSQFRDSVSSVDKYFLQSFVDAYHKKEAFELRKYESAFLDFCQLIDRLILFQKKRKHTGGFCVPYYVKTDISYDGTIKFCDFLEGYSYGYFYSMYHFDFKNIRRDMRKVLDYRNTNCRFCWLKDICNLCWKQLVSLENKTLSFEVFKKHCQKHKEQSEYKMYIYLSLLNYDRNIFMNTARYLSKTRLTDS